MQQIVDLLPGRPFGRGTSDLAFTTETSQHSPVSGTSASTTATVGNAYWSNGDLIIIHQTVGMTDGTAPNWEINLVVSGGGTGTLTLLVPLTRTFTTGAQAIRVPEYKDVTLSATTVNGHAWGLFSNPRGGISAIACSGTLTIDVSGVLSQQGRTYGATTADHHGLNHQQWLDAWYGLGSGGFLGGHNSTDGNVSSIGAGYRTVWAGQEQRTTIDNGGGGTGFPSCAGVGNHASTPAGEVEGGNSGTMGGTAGTDDCSALHLGGGGGGMNGPNSMGRWSGGSGGGWWIIWAKKIVIRGLCTAVGGTGNVLEGHCAGAGAGGGFLFNCMLFQGDGTVDVRGGANNGHGPTRGGQGRVRVNYGARNDFTGSILGSYTSNKNVLLQAGVGGSQVVGA